MLERYPRESHGRPEETGASRVRLSESAPKPVPYKFDPNAAIKVITSEHATAVAIEQYRRLAASIHELQVDRGLKTLLVTSALPQDGKTLTVVNLALTLSESYKRRVLLIDADLRRPSVHELFQMRNASGLSDALRSANAELSVREVSPRLKILPAGNPDANPMAGLTSERMRVLLAEAEKSFDWVLLDAPPVGFMPDAELLARLTGAVLLVVGAGKTPHSLVERTINDLGRERIVGVVLNRVEERLLPTERYYQEYATASIR